VKRILALKAVGDILLIHVGYLIAFYIQFLLKGEIEAHNLSAYLNVAPWLTVAAIVVFYGYGFYHSSSARQQWDEIFSATICALALLFLITFSLSYMLYQFGFPRRTIAIATFIQLMLILGWRALIVRWSKKYIDPIKLLIVGPAERALERASHFAKDESGNYQVLAVLVDHDGGDFDLPVYESYEKLPQALDEVRPNSILFCSDIPYKARMEMMMEALSRGVDIFIVPDLYEIMIAKSRLEQFNSVPTFRLTGLVNGRDQLWKRAMDIGLAVIFGLPAAVVILLAAIALKIESPRAPVFYSQERVSRHGRIFRLYKLRTMIPDAEKNTGPVLAGKDDHRITPVGRILRLTRIDELPQLWNVLKGEMSFIGPRAERPFFVEQYSKNIPGYDYRHFINSGITGLAQVEGNYSTSAEDKLRFDLIYMQTFSPLRDFHILMHTIKVMLLKKKAM
jgi:exopolysaccharide biosynthesis polyprenyl glycosylphosphotransferase